VWVSIVVGAAAMHASASTVILQDDFNNASNTAPEIFTGGSTADFWSTHASETGGQLQFGVLNSGPYTGTTKTSIFSGAWDFFTQPITMSVRGLTFTDTSLNGKTFGKNFMNTRFGFTSDTSNAWSGNDGVTVNVRGDGAVSLWFSNNQNNAWGSTPWQTSTNITGITGFDLTLEKGATGVDYTLTIFNAGADVVATGNLAIEPGDWSSAVANTSALFIASQESFTTTNDTDQRYLSTIDSFTLSTIPTPAALPAGLGLLGIAAMKRRR
jgi:hypothetical protein